MNDLLSGLEKFGLDHLENADLYNDNKKKEKVVKSVPEPAPRMTEEDYLFDKTYECPVCYSTIHERTIRTGKARLLRTEMDLRPVYEQIEPLKYGVVVCPVCGYAVCSRYFGGLMNSQREAIREKISMSYKAPTERKLTYTYEEALERYQLSLANALVKRAKASEKAYICLKSAWLLRSMGEHLDSSAEDYEQQIARIRDQENAFAQNALEGLVTARQTETYPMCGMDETTAEYLIAALAMNAGQYELSARLISEILVSRTANRRMKDRARDVKEELIARIKEKKKNES